MITSVTINPSLSRLRLSFYLALALVYGLFLASLPSENFLDFISYIDYGDNSIVILDRNIGEGVLTLLANEPIWLILNICLRFFLEPDMLVRVIIFLSAASTAWLILRHYPSQFIFIILILFLPQIIKNYLIHLRQGVAISVFLWGWFRVNRFARWSLMTLPPLIHSSFFIILALLIASSFLGYLLISPGLKIVSVLSLSTLVTLSLGAMAQLLGARQSASYEFTRSEGGGLGFIVWLVLIAIVLSAGRSWLTSHLFEVSIPILYIVSYWSLEVSARIFESGLLIFLLSALSLPQRNRKLFWFLIFVYSGLDWYLRFQKPGLGFFAN